MKRHLNLTIPWIILGNFAILLRKELVTQAIIILAFLILYAIVDITRSKCISHTLFYWGSIACIAICLIILQNNSEGQWVYLLLCLPIFNTF